MTDINALLTKEYPDMKPEEALAGPVAKAVLGELPQFSNRRDYQISNVTRLAPGNFAIAYGIDPTIRSAGGRMGETFVVIQERSDKGPNGEIRYGALGGYTNVDNNPEKQSRQEQPAQGCMRELGEEMLDDKGMPIWKLTPERFCVRNILSVGNDYRKPNNPVAYLGYALELTPQELAAARQHAQRMASDPAYAAGVTTASEGEVSRIMVLPLSKALELSADSFTHPHEYEAMKELQVRLAERAANKASGIA